MAEVDTTARANASPFKTCPIISELRQIRVLQLLQGLPHEELECRLAATSLPEPDRSNAKQILKYEALSYTWGEGESVPITINGKKGLTITSNLAAALKRFRLQYKSRSLWVDALCINQEDLAERAGQVRLMGDIFSSATGVLVWLGDVVDNNWMLPMEDNRITYETVHDSFRFYNSPEIRPQGSIDVTATEMQRCALHSALHGTSPSWWTRTWVVQEFCKAPSNLQMCYGPHEENIDDFFSHEGLLWQLVSHNGEDLICQSFWSAYYRLKDIRTKVRQGPLTILDFVENCFQATATDERDKAYSLRSMISINEARWIEPDYQVSILAVFAKATFASIMGSGHLGILRFCWQTSTRNPGLPSWTVDFDDAGLLPDEAIRGQLRPLGHFEQTEPWNHSAAHSHHTQPSMDEITGHLVLFGRMYDRVASVHTFDRCKLLDGKAPIISSSQARQITSMLSNNLRLRNPRQSMFLTNISKHRSRNVLEYAIDIFKGWYEEVGSYTPRITAHNTLTDYAWFSATQEASEYSIFITNAGYIGFVRGAIKADDLLVLLHSAPLPALMRQGNEDGTFVFTGFGIVTGLLGEHTQHQPSTAADDVCFELA